MKVKVPRQVTLSERDCRTPLSRDEFYTWAWSALADEGIIGVHEGTLLSADAAEQGFETDAWTLDAAEAPRERDWISNQSLATAEIYFATLEGAKKGAEKLQKIAGLEVGEIEEQQPEDWDAQWKAAFLNSPNGVEVPPFWRILPPWVAEPADSAGKRILRINPGAGFGTGTHETTQLCLEAIGDSSIVAGERVLDFGSGSGILAIGAALVGAQVDAVEIDPLAIDNAVENARLNQVESRLHYSLTLDAAHGPYRVVIANILRPVLLEFAEQLVSRLNRQCAGWAVILSGLIETDTAEVSKKYSTLLGFEPEKRSLGEWRSLVWRG
jgi:ribosomal protein L11 methyltransferase